ncbi:MAG TPA: redoxin family protein [Candidatus Angelobacter sp.]
MFRACWFLVQLLLLAPAAVVAQQTSDPVTQALAQGDTYRNKKRYDLALESYHKADKLSRHTSALAYLRIASINRLQGNFSDALDDAKHALKLAGDDKHFAVQAHLFRASLLSSMASKPTDKKFREAEEDVRAALALQPENAVARYNLGMVLLKQERDSEGVAELTAFTAISGADPADVARARSYAANPLRARTPFAPGFSFTTLEKENISNVALKGKVVLLDFWGTWCPPCRQSVPMLIALNKKYANKPFQLVGISSDHDEEIWRSYVQDHRMTWTEYIDHSGSVLKAFDIDAYPTYILIDKDGVVRLRQSGLGPFTGGALEEAIDKALKRPSNPELAEAASSPPPPAPANTAPTLATRPPSVAPGPSSSPSASRPGSEVSLSADAAGLEGWAVTENVYKNRELHLTYEFPRNWNASKPETLRALNQRTEAANRAAMLQRNPDASPPQHITINRVVFSASLKGEDDGQRLLLPCLRIYAVPSRAGALNLSRFAQMAESMATGSNAKLLAPPIEIMVKGHQFVRADLVHNAGRNQLYRAFVQTLAAGYLVSINFYASSAEELETLAASLQSISIEESP